MKQLWGSWSCEADGRSPNPVKQAWCGFSHERLWCSLAVRPFIALPARISHQGCAAGSVAGPVMGSHCLALSDAHVRSLASRVRRRGEARLCHPLAALRCQHMGPRIPVAAVDHGSSPATITMGWPGFPAMGGRHGSASASQDQQGVSCPLPQTGLSLRTGDPTPWQASWADSCRKDSRSGRCAPPQRAWWSRSETKGPGRNAQGLLFHRLSISAPLARAAPWSNAPC